MIYAQPRQRRTAVLTAAPAGIAADLRFRIVDPPATLVLAETGAGIAEGPVGVYSIDFDAPVGSGDYLLVWRRVSDGTEIVEELNVGWSTPAAIAAPVGPSYATPDALREELQIDAVALDDPAASRLIADAEERVDELVGFGAGIDTATGRRLTIANLETWQAAKVQRATVVFAAALQRDPTAFDPPRYASVSGPDFSKSQPTGSGIAPAARRARRLAGQLLAEAGLRVTAVRASA